MKGRILQESLREAKPLFKKLIPPRNWDIYSYHGEGDTGGEVGI